jgi:hypothetical protein
LKLFITGLKLPSTQQVGIVWRPKNKLRAKEPLEVSGAKKELNQHLADK